LALRIKVKQYGKGATIFIYDHDRFYTEADKIEIFERTYTKVTLKKNNPNCRETLQ